MKSKYSLLCVGLTAVLSICLLCGLGGCQPKQVSEEAAIAPVFFPPPPNQPRLQFLTSYLGAGDFGGAPKANFLETFLLGAPKKNPEQIIKPYGVAIHEGKIYVCDIGQDQIKVVDLKKKKFSTFPGGRSLQKPVNICIDADGTKYVADSLGGAIFVYTSDDKLKSFLGKDLQIKPLAVAVRDNRMYIIDDFSKQVLVLDKTSGKLLERIGRQMTDDTEASDDSEEATGDTEAASYLKFPLISGVALDQQGNIYVSDKINSRVTKLDASGKYVRSYGKLGTAAGNLVRAKGVAIDREDRIWVVDAGPAQAVKVYRGNDGQSLMIFGTLSKDPGYMYNPASICIDYDNVDLFREYAVDGAELEFLVIVTNQFGPNKVSVYGFGQFPAVAPPAEVEERPEESLQADTDTKAE